MSTILALGGWEAVRREAIAANRVIRPAPTMRAAISCRTPATGDQTVSEVSGLADTRRRWIGVDLGDAFVGNDRKIVTTRPKMVASLHAGTIPYAFAQRVRSTTLGGASTCL
jgi:hypothetical protein